MSPEIQALILQKLEKLEGKLDDVRTKDLPQVKVDVALLVKGAETSSKWLAAGTGVAAVIISVLLSYLKP